MHVGNHTMEEGRSHDTEQTVTNEERLAYGEITPRDRLQNQIRLAMDLYEDENGPVDHDKFHKDMDFRNGIMARWTAGGDRSYSRAYKEMESSEWLAKHKELKGDIFKIKIKHLLDFIRETSFPIHE